jgi:hypothetical protein
LEHRRELDDFRMNWNPERAAGNPAHITIAYHDEAPDPELLAQRLRDLVGEITPFRLTIGAARRFSGSAGGAFLEVHDPTEAVTQLRSRLLAPPFVRRSRFGLHVTLLHPDQGWRVDSAWSAIEALALPGIFEVTELQRIGPANEVLETVPLRNVSDLRSRGVVEQ